MSRIPRRYAVHLHMSGGQTETVHFPTLEGEYLVVRPNGVIGIHVEPKFNALDE